MSYISNSQTSASIKTLQTDLFRVAVRPAGHSWSTQPLLERYGAYALCAVRNYMTVAAAEVYRYGDILLFGLLDQLWI
jgi:hypothetical protein